MRDTFKYERNEKNGRFLAYGSFQKTRQGGDTGSFEGACCGEERI